MGDSESNEEDFRELRSMEDAMWYRPATDILEALRKDSVDDLFHRHFRGMQKTLWIASLHPEMGMDMDDFIQAAERNTSVASIYIEIPSKLEGLNEKELDQWRRQWSDFGRGIGNLKSLQEMTLGIQDPVVGMELDGNYISADIDMDVAALMVCRASRMKRLKVDFDITIDDDCDAFAVAIQAHPHLKCIEFSCRTDQTPIATLGSQLGTIPNLTTITFDSFPRHGVQFRTLPHSFFSHLQFVSNLTELSLRRCMLTEKQCGLLASSLEKLNINRLDLSDSCFLGSGGPAFAEVLGKLATLEHFSISLLGLGTKQICETLSRALLVQSKIRSVSIQEVSRELQGADIFTRFEPAWLIPLFQTISQLPSIQKLQIEGIDRWDNDVADEFRRLLELPTSAITILKVASSGLAVMWDRIEPFLRVNKALRSLTISNCIDCAGAAKLVASLRCNQFLQHLEIDATDGRPCYECRSDYYNWCSRSQGQNDCFLSFCNSNTVERELRCRSDMICALNKAGRRYILEHQGDSSHGMDVLTHGNNNVDPIYFRLPENPSLCKHEAKYALKQGALMSSKKRKFGSVI